MDSSAPFVSIIIPVYNRPATLQAALDSISYPNYEAIVVDDGSSPPIAEAIDFSHYNHVKFIQKENGGASSARNTALSAASGDYIAYLDSDDIYLPPKIEKLISLLESHPDIDFAFHNIGRFRYNDQQMEHFPKTHADYFPIINKTKKTSLKISHNTYVIKSEKIFELLTSGFPIFPSSVVMRRRLMETNGVWDITRKVCGDMEYFARALVKTDAIYIDEVLTMMGINDDNLSRFYKRQVEGDIKILEDFIERETFKNRYNKILLNSLSKRYRTLGWILKREKKYSESVTIYKKAFAIRPTLNSAQNIIKGALRLR